MALETGTYISDLVVTNPTASDAKSNGDDHLRLLKSTIKTTFPNVTGAMTATHTELSYAVGVTSAIQPQLTARGLIAGQAWTGTHTFPTQASGTTGAYAATVDYVNAQAFSAALPGQLGNSGKYLTTNGTAASWNDITPVFVDKGNSGTTTQTIDYSAGQNQRIAVTGAHTIATSNWPAAGKLGTLLLELVNGAAFTVTWPTIYWVKADGSFTTTFASNGVTLQTAGTDYILLWTRDGGTTIRGKVVR